MLSENPENIHVYIIPQNLWQSNTNTAFTSLIRESVSCGFIRLEPESTISAARNIIRTELNEALLPQDFVFCKNVGRSLACVSDIQETTLSVKIFLPPESEFPELFILDRQTYENTTPSFDQQRGDDALDSKSAVTPRNVQSSRQYHDSTILALPRIVADESTNLLSWDQSGRRTYNGEEESPASSGPGGLLPSVRPSFRPSTMEFSTRQPIEVISRRPSYRQAAFTENLPPDSNQGRKSIFRKEETIILPEAELTKNRRDRGDFRRRSTLPVIKDQELAAITTNIDEMKYELEEMERKQRRRMAALQKAEEEQRLREVAEREEQLAKERQARQEQERLAMGLQAELDKATAALEQAKRDLEAARAEWAKMMAEKEAQLEESKQRLIDLANSKAGDQAALDAERQRLQDDIRRMQSEMAQLMRDWEAKEADLLRQRDEALKKQLEVKKILTSEIGVGVRMLSLPTPQLVPEPVVEETGDESPRSLLAKLRARRLIIERQKIELVRRLRIMTSRHVSARNHARDEWKQRYYQAKKITPLIDWELQKTQSQLDLLLRRTAGLVQQPEAQIIRQVFDTKRHITIEERRLADALLRLSCAVKFRTQTESEVRALLIEMSHRRESMNILQTSSTGLPSSPSRRDILRHESPRYYRKPVRVARTVQPTPMPQQDITREPSKHAQQLTEAISSEPVLSERIV